MIELLSKLLLPISLSATALLAFPTDTPPALPREANDIPSVSIALHHKITDLRTQIERMKLEDSIPLKGQFKLGDRGDSIRNLQKILFDMSYYSGDFSAGYYDADTATSISAFQRSVGLRSTGIFDETTRAKLFDVFIARLYVADRFFPEENILLNIATSSKALADYESQNNLLGASDLSGTCADNLNQTEVVDPTVSEPVSTASVPEPIQTTTVAPTMTSTSSALTLPAIKPVVIPLLPKKSTNLLRLRIRK